MISNSLKDLAIIDNKKIRINHEQLNKIIQKYIFLHVKTQSDIDENEIVYQNLSLSNVVLINQYEEKDQNIIYFILGFKNTILIIEKSQLQILQPLLSTKRSLKICFISKFLDLNLRIKYEILEYDEFRFNQEIKNFNGQLILHYSSSSEMKNIWKIIQPCISGYLIKEGYEKNKKNRLKNLFDEGRPINSPSEIKTIDRKEFIELRLIGTGSISYVMLGYHIEREELIVVKHSNIDDDETAKLIKREIENHSKIDHPFLPKFIGASKKMDFIVMEFVNGITLSENDKIQLNYKEKITIIFELMIIIEYLHRNHFIYRDLKPNNIILDEFKNIVLIDFDRMIKFDDLLNASTKDFSSFYFAPELISNDFSYECDIYSLGLTIYNIMESKKPLKENISEYIKSESFDGMKTLIEKCVNENPKKRPAIIDIIIYYLICFYDEIQIDNLFNLYITKLIKIYELDSEIHQYSYAQLNLAKIFFEGKIVPRDVNKSIQFYTLSANQNNVYAQNELGIHYLENKYINRDIAKSIHYFSLAAKQNYSRAQFKLGDIYLRGKHVQKDIKKAIYYFTLASNQNNSSAQYQLGIIYFNNELVPRNIEKSIYYFTLAANQNHTEAQSFLGSFYLEGEFVPRNIKKSLYFLNLAAKKDDLNALRNLGNLYYTGERVPKDIERSFYYFSRGAEQYDSISQYFLGRIYYDGEGVKRDIKKSIYYFTLSAEQNDPDAQYSLGSIYYQDEYVKQDLQKAIYYLELADRQNVYEAQMKLGMIYITCLNDRKKAIHYFTRASKHDNYLPQLVLGFLNYQGIFVPSNHNKGADFIVQSSKDSSSPISFFSSGFIYHFGMNVEQDIRKAISYYKKASSFNFCPAKNNLGIIYKHGFENIIPKNIGFAIQYFEEAIKIKNDYLAKYNLAHLYFYENPVDDSIEKAIKLLIGSSNNNFFPSKMLLCLASIMEFGIDLNEIIKGLNKIEPISKELENSIRSIMQLKNLDVISVFEENFNLYHDIDFVYNFVYFPIQLKEAYDYSKGNQNQNNDQKKEAINSNFYEGFGLDL